MYKLVFFFLTIFLTETLFAEGVIKVKSDVEIKDAKTITLGLISEFQNIPKSIQNSLSRVNLGRVPIPGEKKVFTSSEIAMAFRKKIRDEHFKDIKLIIPNEILIRYKDHKWSEENVKNELINIWRNYCSDCSFQVQYLNLPYFAKDQHVEDWSLDAGRDLPKGSFNLPVYLKFKNIPLKQYWLSGQVKLYRKVPVVEKAMNIGEIFSEEYIKIVERDVTFAYDSTPELKDLIGKRCSQSLRSGSIIWQNLVLREKAVSRGEIVKLTIGNDRFEVSTMGKAEKDAYIGDTVQVTILKFNKLVSGSVVSKGEVRVE
ncbi:MAG: flagellar basal body P-ring formation protein FlgA [Bdellovibrionaceae bacterium]|nr:flagellar basal body P-ring formation protein FlgA [Pseudobdellovibrionaceae bacterium]